MKVAYDNLVLIPSIIASRVIDRRYTGQENSNLSIVFIERIEKKRNNLLKSQIAYFIKNCDERCRDAYVVNADWFMKCVNSKSNHGRDMLYMWITHWLASYLNKL